MSEPAPRGEWSERNRGFAALSAAGAVIRSAWRDAGLVTPSKGLTARGAAVACLTLVTILAFLHVKAQSAEAMRHSDVLAQLATLKLIDARWDVAVLQSRGPSAPAAEPVQVRDVTAIQRALDAAARLARSNALRTAVLELKKSYAEKADLVTRYQRASSDSRQALEAAMRADAAVSGLVRSAWSDFPQHDRLVAAENLVARVLAEAQQYHHAPTATHRSVLEAAAGDLPQARSLPPPVLGALARLESDVNQLLLLKPLEQMLGERLTVLNTGARADEVAETYRRSLDDALRDRSRYRLALLMYSVVLALLAAYSSVRLYRRYSALELQSEQLGAELAEVRARLGLHEEDAIIIEESASAARPEDIEAANVRFIRRP